MAQRGRPPKYAKTKTSLQGNDLCFLPVAQINQAAQLFNNLARQAQLNRVHIKGMGITGGTSVSTAPGKRKRQAQQQQGGIVTIG